MDPINLTKTLLTIPSPSGKERAIGLYLKKLLETEIPTATIILQEVENRYNILVRIGEQIEQPNLLLTTHIDTVPGDLEIKEDKEYLYGRGACDTKGSIAAMICAATQAYEKGYTNFALLFDVSEESDFSGVEKALSLIQPQCVVIGEPTNFDIVIGQKGLLGLELISKGKRAAGSTPELGDCAITKMCTTLKKLKETELLQTPDLGKTTLNIGKIEGGIAPNVVPDYAKAVVEIRTTTNNELILQTIKNSLQEVELSILYNFEPAINENALQWQFLQSREIVVPYFTEMYFWNKIAPTIVFGPGEYKYAHSNEERIRKEDITKAVQKYEDIIRKWCPQKNNQSKNI